MSDLNTIRVLYRDGLLQLWGIPYEMRRDVGQAPKDLDLVNNRRGWIYLGSSHVDRLTKTAVGWFGSMSVERMEEVKAYLVAHADDLPLNHYEWVTLGVVDVSHGDDERRAP